MQRVIVDTGPIVAVLNRREHAHGQAMAFFNDFAGIAFTTWAVVTETWHLLPPHRRDRLLFWLKLGGVRIAHVAEEDLERVHELIRRYRDRPMALADATLVWLAQRERCCDIVTLDSGFDSYRTASGARFTNHLAREKGQTTNLFAKRAGGAVVSTARHACPGLQKSRP